MKFSIITPCYNSELTITDTLDSIFNQKYKNFEHIIVDGGSTDGTANVIHSHRSKNVIFISEPDSGIYDAMNKGFSHSSGDIVCFLNSDDFYIDDNVLSDVYAAFLNENLDFVYGDLLMVDSNGIVKRRWITGSDCSHLLNGRQIPHPVLFVKKDVLLKINPVFDSSYKIAADLKQQLIFVNKFHSTGFYIKRPLTVMRLGGRSTRDFLSYFQGWMESRRAYNEIFGSGGLLFTARKAASKLSGLISI
jgi:glycosyltransferase involved in cell wall biosynthesis